MTDLEPRYCEAIVRQGTLVDPPEYCEEEALPGSDLCYGHDPDGAEADLAIERAEARKEGYL